MFRSHRTIPTLLLLSGFLAAPLHARRLAVGPGKTYPKPSAAADAVKMGDTVDIDPGVYESDACTWSADNLVLRSVPGQGKRAHLKSNGANAQGKAIWVVSGKGLVIEGIEFSGAKVPDENGAGIRQEAPGALIRDCYFHDNENGILGMGTDLVIEACEFAHNGLGEQGYTHNIYVSEGTSFTLKGCYIHHAVIGHNVKSRAARNIILYNRIMDEADGTSSYDIDLPEGGVAVILGNLIQQGPETDNSIIVAYGAEGIKHAVNEIHFVHNTVVNDRQAGTFISIAGAPTVSRFVNNLFAGPGTVFSGKVTDTAGNVITQNPGFADKAAYDYRLTASSPAIDKGKDAGTGAGMSLVPAFQYIHPLGLAARTASGKPDAGAYELGASGAVRRRPKSGSAAPAGRRPIARGAYVGSEREGGPYTAAGVPVAALRAR